MSIRPLTKTPAFSLTPAWTGRVRQVSPPPPPPKPPYRTTVYFSDLPITHEKDGRKGRITVKTLPPEFLTDPALIREGTLLYNRGWNPSEDPRKAAIFHISEEQFARAAANSPGGIIASFVTLDGGQEKLVGAIWSLQLEYGGEGFPWRTYDALVTPDDYFGGHDPFGTSKHCVSVVVQKDFNGFTTDTEFTVAGRRKKLSIGQMEVVAQRIAARRSPYVTHLFADSRPSSLKSYVEGDLLTDLSIEPDGSIFYYVMSSEGRMRVLADEGGLYVESVRIGKHYLFAFDEYLKAVRPAKGGAVPFDQMVGFHGAGLGAEPFAVLPHSRVKTLPDGRVVMDEDSLGLNLIFRYDLFENFDGFLKDLTREQQLFVKALANHIIGSEISGVRPDPAFVETMQILRDDPSFKRILMGAFSIEKTKVVLAYLAAHPAECRLAAEFKIN